MKTRQQRLSEYDLKYSHIPRDYNERLSWMYDNLHITPSKAQEILNARSGMLSTLCYKTYKIILYEDPIGAARPRARYINRSNLISAAKADTSFIHIYSPHAKENSLYMKRILEDQEFSELEQLICTPCEVIYDGYFHTPPSWSSVDKFLCEIGLQRPLIKPDWDNIGKAYSDMYNGNVWIDDILTIDGRVRKYYSILPRIEIELLYQNMVYNRYQYNSIISRKDFNPNEMTLDYYRRSCNYGNDNV